MKTIPTFLFGTVFALLGSTTAGAAPYHGPSHSHRPPSYRPTPPPVYRPAPSPRERKEYRAQLRLRQLGYYRGPVDGSIGPMTQRAIARFQRDRRLPITGWLDVRTLRALGVI